MELKDKYKIGQIIYRFTSLSSYDNPLAMRCDPSKYEIIGISKKTITVKNLGYASDFTYRVSSGDINGHTWDSLELFWSARLSYLEKECEATRARLSELNGREPSLQGCSNYISIKNG